ncbi:MAG: hypothetical protein R3Y43_05250 [Alphaproteobacteria bacterium]
MALQNVIYFENDFGWTLENEMFFTRFHFYESQDTWEQYFNRWKDGTPYLDDRAFSYYQQEDVADNLEYFHDMEHPLGGLFDNYEPFFIKLLEECEDDCEIYYEDDWAPYEDLDQLYDYEFDEYD